MLLNVVCNNGVNTLLAYDKKGAFRLAALQTEAGKELLQRVGRDKNDLSSIVLVEEDNFYIKSDAILRIGRQLNIPFWVLSTLALPLPHFIRDTVYDQVANNRYSLFGKSPSCRMPDEDSASRFLTEQALGHALPVLTDPEVPFSMIALIDHIRQKDLPAELKCRQVFPTSGGRSTSLWDVASIPLLLEWLDEHMDESTTNEVFEVQEAFAYGISAELTRLRTAEKVSANTRATAAAVQERTKSAAAIAQQQMSDLDAKYRVTEQASAAMRVASQAASRTAAAFGSSARFVSAKALENERVSAAASSLNKLLFSRPKTPSSSGDGAAAYSASPSASAAAPGGPAGPARTEGPLAGFAPAVAAQPAVAKAPAAGASSLASAMAPPAPSPSAPPAAQPAATTKIFTLGDEDEHPK